MSNDYEASRRRLLTRDEVRYGCQTVQAVDWISDSRVYTDDPCAHLGHISEPVPVSPEFGLMVHIQSRYLVDDFVISILQRERAEIRMCTVA